jgi:hypothetical protein
MLWAANRAVRSQIAQLETSAQENPRYTEVSSELSVCAKRCGVDHFGTLTLTKVGEGNY